MIYKYGTFHETKLQKQHFAILNTISFVFQHLSVLSMTAFGSNKI